MITRRELFGYIMRRETNRAIEAERDARKSLRSILENNAGPRMQALYLADAAIKLGTIQEALSEIREIINGNLPDIPEELFERIEELLCEPGKEER